MSPYTSTLAPDDPRMWRRVLARCHPDAGGAADLFVWAGSVRKLVCGELPAVRKLFSRYPKAAGFPPERIAHGLKMLGYVEEAPSTHEVAAALETLDIERSGRSHDAA